MVYSPFLFLIPSRVPKEHFLASISTKCEIMSCTPDSAARCPEHDEQQTYEEQALEDQLTQEQFDNELEKDLEVILTQEQCDEEEGGAEGRAGESAEGEEDGRVIPTLEVIAQHEVYPKGVNSFQRVRQNNS